MRTHLSLAYAHRNPPEGVDVGFLTPDELVETMLEEFTERGDHVFDPFAGYGTTLTAAERLDRVPYGVEYEADRVDAIRDRIDHPDNVRQGDARTVDHDWLPPVDCCFTSPPFMERTDHRNPFRNYAGESTYADYLDDIETAFATVASALAPDGHLVVDVANMKYEGRVTPLAWDVADRVSTSLRFEGEVVVTWEADDESQPDDGVYGYGYDHSYCLVFSNPAE